MSYPKGSSQSSSGSQVCGIGAAGSYSDVIGATTCSSAAKSNNKDENLTPASPTSRSPNLITSPSLIELVPIKDPPLDQVINLELPKSNIINPMNGDMHRYSFTPSHIHVHDK
jgi:hypothetical protein